MSQRLRRQKNSLSESESKETGEYSRRQENIPGDRRIVLVSRRKRRQENSCLGELEITETRIVLLSQRVRRHENSRIGEPEREIGDIRIVVSVSERDKR